MAESYILISALRESPAVTLTPGRARFGNLNWLVKDKDIAPHIPVIDKSKRAVERRFGSPMP